MPSPRPKLQIGKLYQIVMGGYGCRSLWIYKPTSFPPEGWVVIAGETSLRTVDVVEGDVFLCVDLYDRTPVANPRGIFLVCPKRLLEEGNTRYVCVSSSVMVGIGRYD